MLVWTKLIDVIRERLGIEEDADTISRPITKITNKLDRFAEKQDASSAAHVAQAAKLRERALTESTKSQKARARAAKFAELLD